MNEKVGSKHLSRIAILYVRQSSPHQVIRNEESRLLQYAMKDRLYDLGWNDVEVIDDDLGQSAAGSQPVGRQCSGNLGYTQSTSGDNPCLYPLGPFVSSAMAPEQRGGA